MFPHNNCFAISRRLIWERNIFCFFVLTFSLSLVFFFPKRNRPCLTHAPVKDKCFIRQETCSFFFFLLFLFRDFFFLLQFFFGQFDRLPCHLKKKTTHIQSQTNKNMHHFSLSFISIFFCLSPFHYRKYCIYLSIQHTHARMRTHTRVRTHKRGLGRDVKYCHHKSSLIRFL